MRTGDQASSESEDKPKEKTPAGWHKFWAGEVEAAQKRLRKFYKQGNDINRRFLDKREGGDVDTFSAGNRSGMESRLNLFHTNVSTLLAMLYGSVPRIDVAREHHDPDDDTARVAATLYQRILQADVEPSGEDLPTVLKAALQDRLLPGLGVARVRYEFDAQKITVMDPQTMEPTEVEQVTAERVPIDYVHWQDFLWGWARTWNELPWMSFRVFMSKDEVKERFGAAIANNLEYKNQLPSGNQDSRDQTEDKDQQNNVQKAEILEIWSTKEKKVFWWSAGADKILDATDDPLQLKGFWPIPRPMMANVTTTMMVPTADFILAQDLYNQIDELNTRISIITRAIKVVGVYDKSTGNSVGRMLKEGVENDLIPVDNWAMFAEKGGLQGSINWFPVQDVVGVLQTLKQVLDATIEMLNMVTGMSEVMKGGAGGQYTAAASNQMAAKMGSIQVQALQEEFARFASDIEGLKAEVISKHYAPESIYKQSNAQFMPQADQDKVVPAVGLMQTPDIIWRVDIRPESIAMVDYAQLKQERTEFLTAMATFLQSGQAVMKEVPGSTPMILEMIKWGMAGFKGANYMEGMMDQFIEQAKMAEAQSAGQPNDDGKAQEGQVKLQIEQIKQQGAQQKAQAELQKIQAKSQADLQTLQMKLQGEMQKIQADGQSDMTLEQVRAQARLEEIARTLDANIAEIQANMRADLSIERAQAEYDIASQQTEHKNNLVEIGANGAMAARQQNRQTDSN